VLPPIAELAAAPHWRTVDFISDLHLQADERATFDAWHAYLADTPADALFILGDLFEAWPGDDIVQADPFLAGCVQALAAFSSRKPLFVMRGNRDFLLGEAFARDAGATLLADPTALEFEGQRYLLSHGDALCLGDTDYLRFRAQVRQPAWQREFLARPLAERQAVARSLRAQSEDRKRSGAPYADVDTRKASLWLAKAQSDVLVHGHTHRPATHVLGCDRQRLVLSDWDLSAQPPRADALRLTAAGFQRIPLA
jgi:UDP-2,3-diacylglucosamine hydrolase